MVRSINRILLIGMGVLCVALGTLGTFLPVLPTVPFLLLALWCFARSSESFHQWLLHHPRLGKPLREWEQHRIIPVRAKVIAISSMMLSATYVIFYTNSPLYAIMLMVAVMAYGAYSILSKPSRVSAGQGGEHV